MQDDGEDIKSVILPPPYALSCRYTFSKKEEGKYVKFYAYVNSLRVIAQTGVVYVEPQHKTDIRIQSVEPKMMDVEAGGSVKYSLTYHKPRKKETVSEERVPGTTKDNVKWKIKIDGKTERLIIDDEVKMGCRPFNAPEEWAGKEVVLMPYLSSPDINVAVKMNVNIPFRFYSSNGFVIYDREKYKLSVERITREHRASNNRFMDISQDFYLDDKKYTANSCQTLMGRDVNNNFVGNFTGIWPLEELDLFFVIAQGSFIFYDAYFGRGLEHAVIIESTGQFKRLRFKEPALDYKNEFYRISDFIYGQHISRDSLIAIDGIVYNANEAGNYLWGMVLEYHACFINPNYIAEKASNFAERTDEPWEQRAITRGRNKGSSLLNKANRDNSIKEIILKNRLEYRLYYNWYD